MSDKLSSGNSSNFNDTESDPEYVPSWNIIPGLVRPSKPVTRAQSLHKKCSSQNQHRRSNSLNNLSSMNIKDKNSVFNPNHFNGKNSLS